MSNLKQYEKFQKQWIEKIANDISNMKQVLPYYCNAIQVNISLPKESIYVSIEFQRTLNDDTIASYQDFNTDMLFKKASIKLTYDNNIYYDIFRFYNDNWQTSKQSLNKLNKFIKESKTLESDENLLNTLGEIVLDHLDNTKPKTNKQVIGYISY